VGPEVSALQVVPERTATAPVCAADVPTTTHVVVDVHDTPVHAGDPVSPWTVAVVHDNGWVRSPEPTRIVLVNVVAKQSVVDGQARPVTPETTDEIEIGVHAPPLQTASFVDEPDVPKVSARPTTQTEVEGQAMAERLPIVGTIETADHEAPPFVVSSTEAGPSLGSELFELLQPPAA
jgi:hypothetical protein